MTEPDHTWRECLPESLYLSGVTKRLHAAGDDFGVAQEQMTAAIVAAVEALSDEQREHFHRFTCGNADDPAAVTTAEHVAGTISESLLPHVAPAPSQLPISEPGVYVLTLDGPPTAAEEERCEEVVTRTGRVVERYVAGVGSGRPAAGHAVPRVGAGADGRAGRRTGALPRADRRVHPADDVH